MKAIVTTTIYEPTKAMKMFATMEDWNLIVVGDKKTPHDIYENMEGVTYLSPDDQDKICPKLSELIGWNKIMRRNIGFIEAYRLGADLVASIDDDNIPYDNWGEEIFIGQNIDVDMYLPENGCFDPLSATDYPELWHRGYPPQLLSTKMDFSVYDANVKVDIQADFWDGDPDIDAICRMEHNPCCDFRNITKPFASTTLSPFNSQNTFYSMDVVKNYFVLPHVGRMDDIWMSYYVEALGYKVVYNKPTVYQDRNAQDLTRNLEHEVIGYLNTYKLIEELKDDPEKLQLFVPEMTWKAFQEYKKYFKE